MFFNNTKDSFNEPVVTLESLGIKDPSAFVETSIIAEFAELNSEQKKMFLESEYCTSLVESGKLRRKTMVRLSYTADLDRRAKMAALELAKQNNDPLWKKLRKNRVIERILLGKIVKKYGPKAGKVAKTQQRDYIRSGMRATPNFDKAGGADRVSK